MGKASSAKKVARAARAGGSRRIGRQRNLGFPIVISVIMILGLLLVWTARERRQATADPKTDDHWHAAYGIYLCDQFLPPEPQEVTDALGIHTHGDGVIHIHPFLASAAGVNARLGLFFEDVQVTVTDSEISVPAGDAVKEGEDQCDGEDAIVQVAMWNSADEAAAGDKPTQIFTNDFSKIRFTRDRQAFTIAFLPEGATIPPPESIPQLDQLTDVPGATSTTLPGDTTTTAPGETTTTAPGETTSSTVAGETTTSSGPPGSDSTTTTTAP